MGVPLPGCLAAAVCQLTRVTQSLADFEANIATSVISQHPCSFSPTVTPLWHGRADPFLLSSLVHNTLTLLPKLLTCLSFPWSLSWQHKLSPSLHLYPVFVLSYHWKPQEKSTLQIHYFLFHLQNFRRVFNLWLAGQRSCLAVESLLDLQQWALLSPSLTYCSFLCLSYLALDFFLLLLSCCTS